MRFKGLDLNLLLAFDALVELRNVSRAADRLGLSQPAVSSILSRLRDYFQDELLVAHSKRMYPTPFAERLMPQVRSLLQAADSVIATSTPFDPTTAERTFRIIGSDYVVAAILAGITARFATIAPGVRLEFILPDDASLSSLTKGEMDLMISPAEFLSPQLPKELLYEETHVVAGWRDNPLFKSAIGETEFMAASHVTVSIGSHRTLTFGDRQLNLMGKTRNVDAVLSSFTMVPWMIIGTSRLALMHKRLAHAMAAYFPISYAPLPFDFPTMQEMVQFHPTRATDDGLRWLINELRQAAG